MLYCTVSLKQPPSPGQQSFHNCTQWNLCTVVTLGPTSYDYNTRGGWQWLYYRELYISIICMLWPDEVTSVGRFGYHKEWSTEQVRTFWKLNTAYIRFPPPVSRGQTLFLIKGKGVGYGHGAVCHPAPWSAYQSQHSIQSHDTWSTWLTGKFKISVWVESEPEVWEVYWARSVLSHELEHNRNRNRGCRKVVSFTLLIAIMTSWLDLRE